MKRKVKQLPPPEYVLDHFRYREEVYTRGGSVLGVWSVSRVRRLRARATQGVSTGSGTFAR